MEKKSLSIQDEEEFAGNLVNWEIDRHQEHTLIKDVKTDTYQEALGALNEIAQLAQKEDHHPELCLSYNRLRIELYTHKIHGLSEEDFKMAVKIDEILERMRLL